MIGTYVCTYTVPYSNTIFLKDFGLFTSCYFLLLSPSDPLLHPHTFFTLSFLFLPPLFPSFFSSSFAFSFTHSLSPYLSLTPFRLSHLFSPHPIPPLIPFFFSPPYHRANTRKVITAVTMGHDARTYILTPYCSVPYIMLYCIIY